MPRHKKHADNPGDSSSSGSIMDDTDREVSCLTDRAFRSLCVAEEEALSELQQKGSPNKTLQSTISNQVSLNHTTSRSNFLNRLSIRSNERTKWTNTFQQAPKPINEERKGFKKTSTKPSIVEFSVPDLRKHSQRSKVSSLIKTFDNIENEYPVVATPGTPRTSLKNSQKGKVQQPCDQELSGVLNNHNEVSEFSDACHENYWLNEKYDAQNKKISQNRGHPGHDGSSARELSASQRSGHTTQSPLKKNLKHQKDIGKEPANKSSFLHSEHSAFKSWSDHHKKHFEPLDCVEWLAEQVLIQGCDVLHPLQTTHTSACNELHSKSTTEPNHPLLIEEEPTPHAPTTQRPRAMVRLQENEARTEVISPSSSSLISSSNAMVKKQGKKLPIAIPSSISSHKTIAKSPQQGPLVESPLPLTSSRLKPLVKNQGKERLVSSPSALPLPTTISNREIIDCQKNELPLNLSESSRITAEVQEKEFLGDFPLLTPPVRRNKFNRREATVEASAFLPVSSNISPMPLSSNQDKGSHLGPSSPSQLLSTKNVTNQNQIFHTEAVPVVQNKMGMVRHPENEGKSSSSAFSTIISATTIKAQQNECVSLLPLKTPSRYCPRDTDQEKEVLMMAPSSRSPQTRQALIPKQTHDLLSGADPLPSTMQMNKRTIIHQEVGVPSAADGKLVMIDKPKDVSKGASSPLLLPNINTTEDKNQTLDDPQQVASMLHLPLEPNKANDDDLLLDVPVPTYRNMLENKDHSVIEDSSSLSCDSQAAKCVVNPQASDQKHNPGIAFTPWRRGKVKQRIQQENSKDNAKTQDNLHLHRRPTSAAAQFAETNQENVTSDTSSSFNITRLLTPIIQRKNITEALEDDVERITPPLGDKSAARDQEPRLVGDGISRENYKAKASSLLFNIKDVRKRVKSTYSSSPLLKQSDDHGRTERKRVENDKVDKGKVEKRKKEIENVSKLREQEMLEKEAMLKERLASETSKKEIMEREKLEREKLEKEKLEREKLEKEKLEREQRENQERENKLKLEREKLEREKIEKLEREKLERLEREKIEREKWEKLERERIEKKKKEKQEREKIIREKFERENMEKQEREKIVREKLRMQKIEKEREEKEKTEREKNEREKIEREKNERKNDREKTEREKIEKEKNERETIERERTESEKTKREKNEREKIERERTEREKIERERTESENIGKERAEMEKTEMEKNENETLEREHLKKKLSKLEQDKIHREKEEAERKKIEWENFEDRIPKENLEKDAIKRESLERENFEKLKAEKAVKEKAEREKDQEIEGKKLKKELSEKQKLEGEQREKFEKERLAMEKIKKEQTELEKTEKETTEMKIIETDRIEREKTMADETKRENCQRVRLQKEATKKIENDETANDHDEKGKTEREMMGKSNNENKGLEGTRQEKKLEKNEREQLEENIDQNNTERNIEEKIEIVKTENDKMEQEKTATAERESTDNIQYENFVKQEKEAHLIEGKNKSTDKQNLNSFQKEKHEMQNTEEKHTQKKKIEKECNMDMMLKNGETENEGGESNMENGKSDIMKTENKHCNTPGIDLQEEQNKVCIRKENLTQQHLVHDSRTFQMENKSELNGNMADNYLTLSSPQTIQDNVCTLREEQPKKSKLKDLDRDIGVEKPETSVFQHKPLNALSATIESITTDEETSLGHRREIGDSRKAKTSKSLYLSVEEQPPDEEKAISKAKQNERKKYADVMPERSVTTKDVSKEELQYYSLSTSSPESEESTNETQGERRWAWKDIRMKQHEDGKVIGGLSPERQATNGTDSGATKRCSSAMLKPSLFAIKDNRCKSSLVTRAVKLPLPRSLSEDCLLSCQWDGGLHSGDMIGKERLSFRDLRDAGKLEEKPQDLNTKEKPLKTKSNGHGFLSGFRRIMKQFSQPNGTPISPLKMSDRCHSLPKLNDTDADVGHLFSKTGKSKELEGRPKLRDTASFIHARSISFESCTSPEDGIFYSVPEYRMETSTDDSLLNRRGGSALDSALNNEIMTSPVLSSYFEDCHNSPASAVSEDLSHFVDSVEYLEDIVCSYATSPTSESIACSFVASPMSENTTSSGFTTAMSTSEGFPSPTAMEEPLKHSPESIVAIDPVGSLAHNVVNVDNSEANKEGKEKQNQLDKMIGKPPTVPPKTEKALRRAKRLASKRRKNEAQQQKKIYVDGTEPVLTVPSPMTVSSSPVALTSSMPSLSHHTLDFKPVDPRVMRHSGATSLTPLSPMPLTQRKLLQDPDSGQYFVVDVPVQVQLKMFYDPDTGKYIQVSVPSSNVNHMQSSSMEDLNSPCVLYPEYLPLSVTSLPPTRSSSQLSAPAVLMQEQVKTEKREAWNRDLANRDFAEKQPYIEPVCDSYSSSPYSMDTDSYDSRRHDIISIGDLDEFAVEGIS